MAMVLTYLTLLVLFVLPMGLSWYLQGMVRSLHGERGRMLTPERLAARSRSPVRSRPRSACPMHTSRIENWTGQSLQRAAADPGPLWRRSFGLPVWTIFLVLYPPAQLRLPGD